MKPIIGITSDFAVSKETYFLNKAYASCITDAGGIPMFLSYDLKNVEEYLSLVSGLLFSGGSDVEPCHYGADPHEKTQEPIRERDDFELKLCREAIANDIPYLGICRGAQLLNVALGGNLFQHIENHRFDPSERKYKRKTIHDVDIVPGSKLHGIVKRTVLSVNSFHHQCVGDVLGKDVIVSSRSSEGFAESIEVANKRFAIAVQWHPEELAEIDTNHAAIYRDFVIEAKRSIKN